MKKFLVSLLLMSDACYSYAQEEVDSETTQPISISGVEVNSASPKFGLGVTVGYNASTLLLEDDCQFGSGFNAGFIGLLTFAETNYGYLFFEPSVLYSRECYNTSLAKQWGHYYCALIGSSSQENVSKEYFNHLKVPAQFGYEFKLGNVVTLGPKVGLEYEHFFLKDDNDINYLNLLAGLNFSYKRKFRLLLGWQNNMRTLGKIDERSSDYVNVNANLAYLFF